MKSRSSGDRRHGDFLRPDGGLAFRQELQRTHAIAADRLEQVEGVAALRMEARADALPYRLAVGEQVVEEEADPLAFDGHPIEAESYRTGRQKSKLDELAKAGGDRVLALSLDVTDAKAVQGAVEQALRRFGRLDVVLDNAGYAVLGGFEESSDAELRAQMETNFFGAMHLTRSPWTDRSAVADTFRRFMLFADKRVALNETKRWLAEHLPVG